MAAVLSACNTYLAIFCMTLYKNRNATFEPLGSDGNQRDHSERSPICRAVARLDPFRQGDLPTETGARVSGLSRVTVTQRLRYLFESGLVVEGENTETQRGRPARSVALNPNFGIVLTADVGESVIRLAAVDLSLRLLAETTVELDVASGPTKTLSEIVRAGRKLLREVGQVQSRVLGIGLSLPAPVNHGAGRVVGPSVMRGWDDFDIRTAILQGAMGAQVQVENDVNLMALAEHRHYWPTVNHFLYIKAGTGIGSGILIDGAIYRGARGASGDIGHIQFDEAKAPLCRCGKFGCVEARAAGGRSLAISGPTDLLRIMRATSWRLSRRVSLTLFGECEKQAASSAKSPQTSLASLNPTKIIVGGTLSRAGDIFWPDEGTHISTLPSARARHLALRGALRRVRGNPRRGSSRHRRGACAGRSCRDNRTASELS